MDRYHRQTLLPQIGPGGQERLTRSRVLLVGCGALGTVIAEQMARAGIGFLRICDRDLVETTNLQRQVLFDEADVTAGTPKAIAAAQRLRRINSTIVIEPHVVDVHSGNIESLMDGIDLVMDGTDNAETRYLVNDATVKHARPWVYGACVGTGGRVMGIVPGRSPCLRCLFPDLPEPGALETCDTAGVLASAASVVASLQVVEAMKIILGDASAARELVTIDLWPLRIKTISTADARRQDCPTCGERRFEFLDVRPGAAATSLCGRNTVQVRPASNGTRIDLDAIAGRLEVAGEVERTAFFVRCTLRDGNLSLTLFPDGRAMVHGTADPAVARSIYARFIGN
ncbi:MAG: molybdopterin-synthase adenylyltransferase [Humisphaera sp.]|nr:molybdopterin-synthase adenylyltransferase [Humisphaera sp.]